MRYVVLLATALAMPASAQTTRCQTIGQFTNCIQDVQIQPAAPLSMPAPAPNYSNSMLNSFMAGRSLMELDAADQADRAMRRQEKAAAKRGILAGRLVANGQCSEAEKLALGEGDFNLAQSIRNYCTSQSAPQP